jgi:hypothetical protein
MKCKNKRNEIIANFFMEVNLIVIRNKQNEDDEQPTVE